MAKGKRAAIVAGLRTPFGRREGAFRHLSALDLGRLCVAEMLQRAGVDAAEVGMVVFGQAVPSPSVPNLAREVALGAGLPTDAEAYTLSCGCVTGFRAAVTAIQAVEAGDVDCVVAGGAESASDVPIAASRHLAEALRTASTAKTLTERVQAIAELRPRDLLPVAPGPREPSTGLTLGEHAEQLAKAYGIGRAAQDEIALRSHTLAARAWAEGRFDDEVMPLYVPPLYHAVREDETIDRETSLDDLALFAPAYDERHGTVTTATTAPPVDGAAAMLVMREDKARALGLEPLGYVRGHAFAACDPRDQLLMGAAYAAPRALDRARATLADLDLVDLHEAFAAQVLAIERALASDGFARERLGRDRALGQLDWDRFNVCGGSLALGHPFAATGGRQIVQTLRALRRAGGGLALCTACAAGGLGAAVVLEVA
jgi:acetyl-CoA acyltransferase